jgi:lipopolysaccharide export system permease protein
MSTILRRHYVKEFLRAFAVAGFFLALILSLLDLVDMMGDLSSLRPSLGGLAGYTALVFPRYFLYLMPAAALICSLYTVGRASRAKELVAVMAAGGRIKALLMPFVLLGAVISLAGFALGEFAAPACSEKALEVRQSMKGKSALPSLYQDGMIWLRADDGSIVKIDFFLENTDTLKGISIFRTDGGGLREIVTAEMGVYSAAEKAWTLKGVKRYEVPTGQTEELQEMRYPYLSSLEALREGARKPFEMGILELARYLDRLHRAGFRNQRLEVELQSKISYPLVSLFMVVIGISFSARRKMGGLAAAAIGLLISLFYFFAYTMALSLGYAGILPPPVAAWAMPLAFGAVSLMLFRKIPE